MNTLMKKRYDITQCSFYKCRSKRRLMNLLMLNEEEFKNIKKKICYHSFTQAKKDGDKRVITAPNEELKRIQKRILKLFSYVKRPEWLISGERGKSYIDNGRYHINSNYFLTMDIRKFYDNCKREYVYRFFNDNLEMSKDTAAILTDLVTYEGKVPTGCPTSQIIAYYAYQKMFHSIHKVAEMHGCKFSLYVDDMTFSSSSPFNPDSLRNDIDKILRKYGHRPKYSKVKYYSKNKFKLITGVTISSDHKLLVSNTLRKKIYDGAMSQIEMDRQKKVTIPKELRRLKGRIQAARVVNPHIFPEVNRFVEEKLYSSGSYK
ncbi:reverse transcriptase [Paenibacillus sp. 32O-W]|nr:reverse transcriptase [Paenibacillus sp. 32O-W]